jgi:hypothetical protein
LHIDHQKRRAHRIAHVYDHSASTSPP